MFSTPYILDLLFGIVFDHTERSAVYSGTQLPAFEKKNYFCLRVIRDAIMAIYSSETFKTVYKSKNSTLCGYSLLQKSQISIGNTKIVPKVMSNNCL